MTTPGSDRAAAALAGLDRLGRALRPWLQRAGRGVLAGLRGLGRGGVRRRRALGAVGLRVAWWSALALLLVGGRPVLGMTPIPERWLTLAPFAAGLLLCAALRLLAPRAHLRVGALGLGALHGTALVGVWTAFGG